MLDPDPHKTDADPKHWITMACACTTKYTSIGMQCPLKKKKQVYKNISTTNDLLSEVLEYRAVLF
jgi:hypothetical protein